MTTICRFAGGRLPERGRDDIFRAGDPGGEKTIEPSHPAALSDTVGASSSAPGAATPDMSDSYDAYLSTGLYNAHYPRADRRTLSALTVFDGGVFRLFDGRSAPDEVPLDHRRRRMSFQSLALAGRILITLGSLATSRPAAALPALSAS